MSARTQQVIPFPPPARAEAPICSAVTVLIDALCDGANRIQQASPLNAHLPRPIPAYRWSEGLIGLGAALALHLIWLAVAPSKKLAPITPPTPIQVQWIASPQPHAICLSLRRKNHTKRESRPQHPRPNRTNRHR